MRGRSRTIKPELYDDEMLADLELKSGLPLFRIFTGLWCFADREGRFEWSPRSLRGKIHPCWEGDFGGALELLAAHSYIIRYTVNGKDYGYVRTFKEHQPIHPREPRSLLPAPSEHASQPSPGKAGTRNGESGVRRGESAEDHECLDVEIEVEAEVEVDPDQARARGDATALHREPKATRRRPKVSLPDDLAPNETCAYLATRLGVNLADEFAAFRDHHLKVDSRFSDWQAAIRTWIRNAPKFAPKSSPRNRRSEADDRLREQTDRVQMLREQEAEEERRAAGGGP